MHLKACGGLCLTLGNLLCAPHLTRLTGSALGGDADSDAGSGADRNARRSILLSSVAPTRRGAARSRLLTLVATPAVLHAELVAPTEVPLFHRSTYVAGDSSRATRTAGTSPSPSSALRSKKGPTHSDSGSECSWLAAGHDGFASDSQCAATGSDRSSDACMPVRVSERTFEAQRLDGGAAAGAQPFSCNDEGTPAGLMQALPVSEQPPPNARSRALRRDVSQLEMRCGVRLSTDKHPGAAWAVADTAASHERHRPGSASEARAPGLAHAARPVSAGAQLQGSSSSNPLGSRDAGHGSRASKAHSAGQSAPLLRRNVSQLEQVGVHMQQADSPAAATRAAAPSRQSPSPSRHHEARSAGDPTRRQRRHGASRRKSDTAPQAEGAAQAHASKMLQRSVSHLQQLTGHPPQLTPEAALGPPSRHSGAPLIAGPSASLQRSVSQLEQRMRAASAGLDSASLARDGGYARASHEAWADEQRGMRGAAQSGSQWSWGGGAQDATPASGQPLVGHEPGALVEPDGMATWTPSKAGPNAVRWTNAVRLVSRAGQELQAARSSFGT